MGEQELLVERRQVELPAGLVDELRAIGFRIVEKPVLDPPHGLLDRRFALSHFASDQENIGTRMSRLYDMVTFDCYGTLIDWESGIAAAFLEAARADGLSLDRGEVLRAYAELEPLVEAEAYRSYREVLTETARRVAERPGARL